MPSISAVPFTDVPAVRVMVNWADTPGAIYGSVFRVDCETGEEVQLRPYVAYNENGFLLLSCGQAVFWDTEFPFDRCVRYCTRAQLTDGTTITGPAAPLVLDLFNRVVADSWGTPNIGPPWTNIGGTSATDYDVNGTAGTHTHTAVNSLHHSVVETGTNDQDVSVDMMVTPNAGGGAQVNQWVLGRFIDVNNYYGAILSLDTSAIMSVFLIKRVAGALSVLTTQALTPAPHLPNDWWSVRFQVQGSRLRVKAWLASQPQPDAWTSTATDTALTSGTLAGTASRLEPGNTNTLPFVFSFDNFVVLPACPELVLVESCSDDIMVSSSGSNMLRDPVRPCNDTRVDMCWTSDPKCVPGRGVFFARMEPATTYTGNSAILNAFNAARPGVASRERSDAAGTLVVVSRSFEDRDALLEELKAGGPLLWQSPPEYGIPDSYIQPGDVTVNRYQPDHRYQPRTFQIPYVTVDRPEGPSQGICGTRIDDLCDLYPTWAAVEAAGLTGLDLLLGAASNNGPSDPNRRRWIDVETGFATWLAVETAPNTWESVRDGE